jgi:indolepyruvate ferredoxin oxidoreductase beta subunit
MDTNIILAGVGGQGILSIAFVIDNAALDAGYHFKQAEVHGMAQRGGAVQSNLRYADHEIHSDLIPTGRADLVLSVEPLEVRRYWHMLSPDGWVVTSATPYVNIPDYPEESELLDQLAEFERIIMVDSGPLAKTAGNLRAQNMVTLGAAIPFLDFTDDQLLRYVKVLFQAKGEKIITVNRTAFALGAAWGRFTKALLDGGADAAAAFRLTRVMDPHTIDPAHAPGWLAALDGRGDHLEGLEGPLDCSKPGAIP